MNKDTKLLLAGGLIIWAILQMNRSQQPAGPYPYPRYPNLPPPPATTGQAFASWARIVMQSVDDIASLWQPGGPFHRLTPEQQQVVDAVAQTAIQWP